MSTRKRRAVVESSDEEESKKEETPTPANSFTASDSEAAVKPTSSTAKKEEDDPKPSTCVFSSLFQPLLQYSRATPRRSRYPKRTCHAGAPTPSVAPHLVKRAASASPLKRKRGKKAGNVQQEEGDEAEGREVPVEDAEDAMHKKYKEAYDVRSASLLATLIVSLTFPFLQAGNNARRSCIDSKTGFNIFDHETYRAVPELSPRGDDIESLKARGWFHRRHIEGGNVQTIELHTSDVRCAVFPSPSCIAHQSIPRRNERSTLGRVPISTRSTSVLCD